MKRATKVILIIIAVLVGISGIVTIFQWNNINAFYNSKKNSLDEIQEKLDENSVQQDKAIFGLAVRKLTDEEKAAIKDGNMGSTEALGKIVETHTNEDAEEAKAKPDTGDKNTSTYPSNSPKSDYDAQLAELIGQIYVLEATYSGSVDNLLSSAVAEYKSLPPVEHTDKSKWNIGVKYLGIATTMESSCDTQMASILSKIESVLIASGKDMSLISRIKNTYEHEKTLKKEYYLSLYS